MFPRVWHRKPLSKENQLLFFNQETDETPSGEQEASTKHSYVESDNQKKK